MKKSARNRIILWSVVSSLLIAVMIFSIFSLSNKFSNDFTFNGMGWSFGYGIPSGNDSSDFSVGGGSIEADKVKSVNIKWVSGEINVQPSSDNKISFSEYMMDDKSDPMKYRLTPDGTLEIYGSPTLFFIRLFSSADDRKNLTVYVPQNKQFTDFNISGIGTDITAKELNSSESTFETTSKSINISGFSGGELALKSVSGDITVLNANCDSVSLENVSGESSFSGKCREFDGNSVSGRIKTEFGGDISDIDLGTVSGEAEITMPKNISGFKAEHETVSGRFSADFPGKSNGNEFVFGDGRVSVDVETVSGDISIK